MSLWLTLETALEALRRNVLRTTLTALGIIIGVAAVIVMMALGNGARRPSRRGSARPGTNLIIVMPGSANVGRRPHGPGRPHHADAGRCGCHRAQVAGHRGLSPGATRARRSCRRSGNWSTQIQGAGAELPTIRDWAMESGAFFTDADVARAGEGGGAGRGRARPAVRRRAWIRPARRSASATSRSWWSACSRARGSRRWARTRTTR